MKEKEIEGKKDWNLGSRGAQAPRGWKQITLDSASGPLSTFGLPGLEGGKESPKVRDQAWAPALSPSNFPTFPRKKDKEKLIRKLLGLEAEELFSARLPCQMVFGSRAGIRAVSQAFLQNENKKKNRRKAVVDCSRIPFLGLAA